MTRKTSKTQEELVGQRLFNEEGLLAGMIQTCVRQVIEAELERHLGAAHYERAPGRRGYRNGTKPRTMRTAVGKLQFDVPQVREGSFRPSAFERYQRSDQALVAAMQEMVVQGVSTRRVKAVLAEMGGFELSATTVSQTMVKLDQQIAQWRERRLDEHLYPYLIIDARYEKVRVGGRVVSRAVLIAAGISTQGRRELLGFWSGDSESEATWGEVFKDLKGRGLKGVELLVSDAHAGIRAALARHLQGVGWQRCRVHMMRELMNKVSWRDRAELAADLKAVYHPEEAGQCLAVAEEVAAKWERRAPKMAEALRAGVEDTLTAKALGRTLWRRLGSSNMLERLMRELKRRTRLSTPFPSVSSLERLVGALVMEIEEDWAVEPARYIVLDRE